MQGSLSNIRDEVNADGWMDGQKDIISALYMQNKSQYYYAQIIYITIYATVYVPWWVVSHNAQTLES